MLTLHFNDAVSLMQDFPWCSLPRAGGAINTIFHIAREVVPYTEQLQNSEFRIAGRAGAF